MRCWNVTKVRLVPIPIFPSRFELPCTLCTQAQSMIQSSIQKLPLRNNFHIVKLIQQSSFITQTFVGNENQNNYSNIESHQRLRVLWNKLVRHNSLMRMEKRSWSFERNIIIDGPLKYFCRVAYWALVEMLLLDCSRTPCGLWNLCNFSGSVDPLDWTAVPHPRFPVQVQILSASGYSRWCLYIVLCTSGWCSKRALGLMFYEQQLVKYPTSNLELLWTLHLRKLQTEIGSKNYVRELMGPSTALLLLKSTRWVLAQRRRTVIRSGFAYWRRSAAVW